MHHLMPQDPIHLYDDHLARSGGSAIVEAAHLGAGEVIDRVRRSGLRGRGGGGFPTGIKWAGAMAASGPRAVVCNAAEGEPGTRKDRALIDANPFVVLEGLVVAAMAIEAEMAVVGIKQRYAAQVERLTEAAAQMAAAGAFDSLEMRIVEGPDDYLLGVETALLEVIEGRDPLPRVEPPYVRGIASDDGEYATVVNNVETLANVPGIVVNGPDRYRSRGTERSPGTMIFTVSGDVENPTVGELALGTPLSVLVYGVGGGVLGGRSPKLVVSGVSNRPLTEGELDTPMSFEAMEAIGSGLGSGGFIVYDDTTCVVEVAAVLSGFLQVGSCGQCPPCKLGTTEFTTGFASLLDGHGTVERVEELAAWTHRVTDANRCGLGGGQRNLAAGILRDFTDDVVACLEGRCPGHRGLVPPILD